jgi:transcriptional regulator of nitric oxide reductase
MVDRVQITRLDDSIPRWQIRDLKVSTSQLRYALRASEEQIQGAVELKPGQQMFIDLYLGGV